MLRKVITIQDLTLCLDKMDASGKIEIYQVLFFIIIVNLFIFNFFYNIIFYNIIFFYLGSCLISMFCYYTFNHKLS